MSVEEIAKTITTSQTELMTTIIIASVSSIAYVVFNAFKHYINKRFEHQDNKLIKNNNGNGNGNGNKKITTTKIGSVSIAHEVEEPDTLEERLSLKIDDALNRSNINMRQISNEVKSRINDIKTDITEVKDDILEIKEDIIDQQDDIRIIKKNASELKRSVKGIQSDFDLHLAYAKQSDSDLDNLTHRVNKINGNNSTNNTNSTNVSKKIKDTKNNNNSNKQTLMKRYNQYHSKA